MCFATVLKPTATELRELIAYSSIPVLVELGADWSPPCQLLRPFVRKMAIDLGTDAHVATLDVDAHRDLRLEWEARSIPQVLFFRHGQIADRLEGFRGYAALQTAITRAMGLMLGDTSPEEALFAATAEWAEATFEAAERPADDLFRRLWNGTGPVRDRLAAAHQAAVARGEMTAEDARRRLREEEDRLMEPMQKERAAATAEARALRLRFVETIDDAVEIYAAAALYKIANQRRAERPSA